MLHRPYNKASILEVHRGSFVSAFESAADAASALQPSREMQPPPLTSSADTGMIDESDAGIAAYSYCSHKL